MKGVVSVVVIMILDLDEKLIRYGVFNKCFNGGKLRKFCEEDEVLKQSEWRKTNRCMF